MLHCQLVAYLWLKQLHGCFLADLRLVAVPLDFAIIRSFAIDGPHEMHKVMAEHLHYVRRCAKEDGFGECSGDSEHDTLVYLSLDDPMPERRDSQAFKKKRVVAYGIAPLHPRKGERDAAMLEFPQRFPPHPLHPAGKTTVMRQSLFSSSHKTPVQGASDAKKSDARKGELLPKLRRWSTGHLHT